MSSQPPSSRHEPKFQYDPERSFRAWLKTVTQHAWSDLARGRHADENLLRIPIDGLADTHDALADLEQRIEYTFHRELLDLAMRRVEPRVKPTTWNAFRLTALENHTGAEAAKQLQIPVAHVFVAKHRLQKLLQAEIKVLLGDDIANANANANGDGDGDTV